MKKLNKYKMVDWYTGQVSREVTIPTKMQGPWVIKDWAGNICFKGQKFEYFEDAWGFLYEKFPDGDDDQTFDDYFVEEL